MKVLNVVGARPNFMKISPLMREMQKARMEASLLHTGQHYDGEMSEVFFQDLGLPVPDIDLGVGSASHARQVAEIMIRFEDVLLQQRPDVVVVVGDVNSTLACSLVAAKLGVPVAHVEAGLRSFDRTMPEEINRLVTDALSDYLFTTCEDANENLRREGVPEDKIFFVGNVMIDSLLANVERAQRSDVLTKLDLQEGNYAVLTLHRPSNVDCPPTFARILEALKEVQREITIVFPAHPRTQARIRELGFAPWVGSMSNLMLLDPLGYLDFLKLMSGSKFVMTDSGGMQEETTVLGVPCLTLRENTERPITVTQGTNTIVGTDPDRIVAESLTIINRGGKKGRVPELWDGRAAKRIVRILAQRVGEGRKE